MSFKFLQIGGICSGRKELEKKKKLKGLKRKRKYTWRMASCQALWQAGKSRNIKEWTKGECELYKE